MGRNLRLQLIPQTRVGLLGRSGVAGIEGGGQILIIGVGLTIFSERLARGGGGIGGQILLESSQGTLRTGEVAGLQGGADGLETPGQLRIFTLIEGLGLICIRGRYGGRAAHIVLLFNGLSIRSVIFAYRLLASAKYAGLYAGSA
jgi:hypothetical protein